MNKKTIIAVVVGLAAGLAARRAMSAGVTRYAVFRVDICDAMPSNPRSPADGCTPTDVVLQLNADGTISRAR